MQNHSGIRFHFCAGDMQLYVHLILKNVAQAFWLAVAVDGHLNP